MQIKHNLFRYIKVFILEDLSIKIMKTSINKKDFTVEDFTKIIYNGVNESGYDFSRTVYYFLNLAHGEDSDEMLWQMLRVLEIIGMKDQKAYERLMEIQDNPYLIKKYFYAMIIGIMRASVNEGEEGEKGVISAGEVNTNE